MGRTVSAVVRMVSAGVAALALLLPTSAFGQQRIHHLFNAQMPTGEIGQRQLAMRPELQGYYQPVRVNVPEGALVSVAEGDFQVNDVGTALVGMQVGQVYRLRIRNLPSKSPGEVYPTIELIDRLHPPPGKEQRHPVPIDIAAEDIALALDGNFVTRAIYVENPQTALPVQETPKAQRYFEALPREDPLQVAGELGRPIAILRMGSLTPGINGPDEGFLFGSPPFVRYPAPAKVEYAPADSDIRNLAPQASGSEPQREQKTTTELPEPVLDAEPDTSERDPFVDDLTSPVEDVPPDAFDEDLAPDMESIDPARPGNGR